MLGALAHRDIRRSGGHATGGGLATAGIFLGAIGSVLFVGWVAVVAFALEAAPPPPTAHAASAPPATAMPAAASARARVLALHPSGGTLRTQLVSQTSSAQRAGEAVLVETTISSCDPCAEIEATVPDPAVQGASRTCGSSAST